MKTKPNKLPNGNAEALTIAHVAPQLRDRLGNAERTIRKLQIQLRDAFTFSDVLASFAPRQATPKRSHRATKPVKTVKR